MAKAMQNLVFNDVQYYTTIEIRASLEAKFRDSYYEK